MQYVIETKRLCKTYGGRTVVHNLDLHVPQGCVYGFIGVLLGQMARVNLPA